MALNAERWGRDQAAPVVATPALMSVVTGGLIFTGAMLAFLVSFLGEQDSHVMLRRMIAAAAVIAGLAIAKCRWLPAWFYPAANVGGSCLITFMLMLGGGGDAAQALAILFVFVTLHSFFFFRWQLGLIYHLFAVAAVLMSVAVFHVLSIPVAFALVVIQTAIGWVVGWLVTAAGDAEIDPITGLANRRGLDRALSRELELAERSGSPLTLGFVDLDHFKTVNDTAGHGAGDKLLRAASEVWSELLPPTALLARQGGDEFAVLLPGSGPAEAFECIESLRRALNVIGHGCSAGVASYAPGLSNSSLMSRADVALYQAKRDGRGRTCVYEGEDRDDELRAGFEAGQLYVAYQPIVELGTRRVTGAEALLRWQHPQRGAVSPAEFIPLAEATGLICELGAFVLERACRTAAAWEHPAAASIAVNVSGPELLQPSYVAQVAKVLAVTGLPAERLVLEVTETSIGADADMSMRTLRALRKMGIRIAVDDFGVGYSSLSRLDRLPVDILKLDQSFIASIPENGDEAPLIAAVAALASAVGLDTIAEGIEQPYQAALLTKYGFTEGQGYLFGRPQDSLVLPLASPTSLPPARHTTETLPAGLAGRPRR
jgi:diguanylate cyclase (GGDEF)-like protein